MDDNDNIIYDPEEISDIKKLCSFINYFETVKPDKACRWKGGDTGKDGVIHMPYPVYENEFNKFIDAFYKTGLTVFNYQDELNRIIPDWQTADINKIIETADLHLVKTILTKCIRAERFHEGSWNNAIRSGLFLSILRRLQNLNNKI